MDLNHLWTFHLVSREGSLAGAARARGVPTSTISRHLTRLESSLGTDLLHRGPRGITLTEAGTELLERSRDPLIDLHDVATALPQGRPRGTLRLTIPSNLANLPWFASLLLRFRQTFPDVGLDVDLSVRPVDLIAEGFDVAFRLASLVPDSPDLVLRPLPTIAVGLYAAPGYLTRRGRPERIEELEHHDFVAARHLAGQPLTLRRGSHTAQVAVEPAMVGDDLSFVLPMVAAGAGFAPIPRPYVSGREGAFVELFPEWSLPPLRPSLVWPRRRFMVPRIRAFVDFIVEGFEAQMTAESGSHTDERVLRRSR